MRDDLGKPIARLRVDGGAAANDVLMEFQSDVSNLTVERPVELETTARGAAMLAGIGVGLFGSGAEAAQMTKIEKQFTPTMSDADRERRWALWRDAVRRTKGRLGS
jgi:glycerol kinase